MRPVAMSRAYKCGDLSESVPLMVPKNAASLPPGKTRIAGEGFRSTQAPKA